MAGKRFKTRKDKEEEKKENKENKEKQKIDNYDYIKFKMDPDEDYKLKDNDNDLKLKDNYNDSDKDNDLKLKDNGNTNLFAKRKQEKLNQVEFEEKLRKIQEKHNAKQKELEKKNSTKKIIS